MQSLDQIRKKSSNQEDLDTIKQNRKRCIIGTPDIVKQQLTDLQDLYQTDEFMMITNIFDFAAKKKSYQLLAEAVLQL